MSEAILHPATQTLQLMAEGTLGDSERAVVESHLLGCAACQTEVDEWRALFAVLAGVPRYAPAVGFADRVMVHVRLPEPWYVRAAARVGAQVQVFTPKTTRGWAFASALMALPLVMFGVLAAWILSQPYTTPQGLLSFAFGRAQSAVATTANGIFAGVLQSDVALFFARALETLSNAGIGAAGALLFSFATAIVLSAWVLYQNLFRMTTRRDNHNYASYSF